MSVSELTKCINTAVDASQDGLSESERVELLAACKKLQSKLETPQEKIFDGIMAPSKVIAIRLGIDMKLFDLDGPSTIKELAAQTGADEILVTRIIRILAACTLFTESPSPTTPILYTPTPLALAYRTNSPYSQAIIHFTTQQEVISALPRYFAQTSHGYRNPSDAFNGPFQFVRQTNLHAFEWIKQRPRLQTAMSAVMQFARGARGVEWYEFWPVEERFSGTGPQEPLIVDVGGGLGHVLVSLKTKFPELKGKMIVQDLQVVVDSIKPGDLPAGIEAQGHDFFTEQPVKRAKAYYLAAVLHDWPDKQALQILGRIKEAMGKESVVLINENCLPERGVSLMATMMDLNMMSGFASLERTERQWGELVREAGLEVVRVWHPEGAGPSVFEARLKE